MIIYRILSFIVNFFCSFLAVITVFGLAMVLANPAALLQIFLFASVVMYGWFSNRFYTKVIVAKEMMSKKLKDWLQVNAIVAFAFSVLGIGNSIYIYLNPHTFDDILKQMPQEMAMPQNLLVNVAIVLMLFCSLLFVHIIWTYMLMKKHKEYFEA